MVAAATAPTFFGSVWRRPKKSSRRRRQHKETLFIEAPNVVHEMKFLVCLSLASAITWAAPQGKVFLTFFNWGSTI